MSGKQKTTSKGLHSKNSSSESNASKKNQSTHTMTLQSVSEQKVKINKVVLKEFIDTDDGNIDKLVEDDDRMGVKKENNKKNKFYETFSMVMHKSSNTGNKNKNSIDNDDTQERTNKRLKTIDEVTGDLIDEGKLWIGSWFKPSKKRRISAKLVLGNDGWVPK